MIRRNESVKQGSLNAAIIQALHGSSATPARGWLQSASPNRRTHHLLRPELPKLEHHQLTNGLRVFLQEDHSLPLVAINLWYDVGSKNERPGLTGFAHLFEHMLFQGSAHVDTNGHFAHIQQVGGVANGSTWYDRTNYYETLPSNALELGLWLESDRMGFLLEALDEEKLATQKSVVLNERRQRVDNAPYGRSSERLNELLYPADHPYHWPVIGYDEDIRAATLEQVHDFFRTYYRPNNAVLTLVGDLEPGAAIALVEQYFGELSPGDAPPEVVVDPFDVTARTESMTDQVALTKSTWATCVAPVGEPEWDVANVLCEVLTGGRSGILTRRLVQELEQLQGVGAYVMPTRLGATLALQAVGKVGQSGAELDEVMASALHELREQGIESEDHERARNALVTSQIEELESVEDRADAISMGATLFDDPLYAFKEAERSLDVTIDQLDDALGTMFDLGGMVQVVVEPTGPEA